MKILLIHNKYGKFSGEEAVVEAQIKLLIDNGHQVVTYFRSSEEIENIPYGKFKAFLSGIHNSHSNRCVKALIQKESPDIVHVHNLYPLISPSILPIIREMKVPIVMTVHNYRLLCPNGLFFDKGEICEKCTGVGKELNCITNNCEGSLFKSTGYALRNFWARVNKYYSDNVSFFICLSNIQKEKLIKYGLSKEKLLVIPNMYRGDLSNEVMYKEGKYIGYIGRISEEKGSDIILKLAIKLPHINFKIAGTYKNDDKLDKTLKNVEYMGFLKNEELNNFYMNCLFTIFPSVCNESFGMSIIEAFGHKKPVIASELGASPEIIENNITGLIYKKSDLNDLLTKVNILINDKRKIREMGEKGYEKVLKIYNPKAYYLQFLNTYNRVLKK